MRLKILILAVGAFMIGGAAYVFAPDSEKPGTTGEPRPQSSNQEDATVVADDDPDDSVAYNSLNFSGDKNQESPSAPQYAFNFQPAKNKPDTPEKYVTIDDKQYPLRVYRALAVPNDPQASQWWVSNANLNSAWDIPSGAGQPVLAVIDTGFGLDHEEFANRWYQNPGETGVASTEQPSALNCADKGQALDASCNLIDEDGDKIVDNESGPAFYQNASRLNCTDQVKPLAKDCNLIDDDGNGYTDDVTGWDFANFDNSPQAGELNPAGDGTRHGTQVAGIAAATGNNSKGIAGVDWNAKILPIQALDDDSYGDTRGVGRAIFYAAQQGADVISISLGSDYPDDYVQAAIHYAISKGSVVVAAAGNDGCDCMVYPANYPEVVGVGALNSSSQLASFSSWGANMDILAPGTLMTTPSWSAANGTSAYSTGVNGTSFSTPLVSGLLTLMAAQQPSATPLQLIAALTENTNRLGLASNTPNTPKLGYGTVDGAKAVTRMVAPQNRQIVYALNPVSRGNFLNSGSPKEIPGIYSVQDCQTGTVPSTPVYELSKNGSIFYTISKAEVLQGQWTGYTASLFAQACLSQPHDLPGNVRALDVGREFRNLFNR